MCVLMTAVKGEGLASAAQLLLGGAGGAVGKHSCLLMLHMPAIDTCVILGACLVFVPFCCKVLCGVFHLHEHQNFPAH